MICLTDIGKEFHLGEHTVRALQDINEEIAHGEHVSIVGASGSGKSTLLHIIGCLDRPTSGSLRLDGKQVAHLSLEELSDVRQNLIGFVFQSFHLVSRLDAAANVELPMVFARIPRSERRRRVSTALDQVGLSARAHHRPSQLSGGERQRIAIARATVMRPRIVLADEPTGNLDSNAGRQVLEVLHEMNLGGITLVVVTHDPNTARRSQRIVVLADGRIVRRLPSKDLSDLNKLYEEVQPESSETAIQ